MIFREAAKEAMSDQGTGDLAMGTADQLEFGQLLADFFFGGTDLVTHNNIIPNDTENT